MAMKESAEKALRLGTRDAQLLYHAGMIARASGESERARELLSRALALSPVFDPLQASLARAVLAERTGARQKLRPTALLLERASIVSRFGLCQNRGPRRLPNRPRSPSLGRCSRMSPGHG